jgi:hypothetical protein
VIKLKRVNKEREKKIEMSDKFKELIKRGRKR